MKGCYGGYVFLLRFVCLNVDHQDLSPEVQFLSLVVLSPSSAAIVPWISIAGWSERVFSSQCSQFLPNTQMLDLINEK